MPPHLLAISFWPLERLSRGNTTLDFIASVSLNDIGGSLFALQDELMGRGFELIMASTSIISVRKDSPSNCFECIINNPFSIAFPFLICLCLTLHTLTLHK